MLSPALLATLLAPGPFANLQPGVASAGLNERVKVNVVFIGFGSGQIDTSAFLADLPEQSKPIVRSRLFYGETEELGIDYGYDYATTFTSPTWNTSFFTALKGLAKPAARTEFQDAYNEQDGTRKVGDNNFIDAPSVEKWLIDHKPPGVDTRNDTIFFINWWGRERLHRPRLHQDRRGRPRHGLRLRRATATAAS